MTHVLQKQDKNTQGIDYKGLKMCKYLYINR